MRHAHGRRRQGWRQQTAGERHDLSVEIRGQHRARTRLQPFGSAAHYKLPNLGWIERVVCRSHQSQDRLGLSEAPFKCALALSKAGGEVGADTRRGWHQILDFQPQTGRKSLI
jgi:hypothetical protein